MQGRFIERRQWLHEVLYLRKTDLIIIKVTLLPPPQGLCLLHQGKSKMQVTDDDEVQ